MPSADKRARKKENARAAKEQREAALKRKRRMRSAIKLRSYAGSRSTNLEQELIVGVLTHRPIHKLAPLILLAQTPRVRSI